VILAGLVYQLFVAHTMILDLTSWIYLVIDSVVLVWDLVVLGKRSYQTPGFLLTAVCCAVLVVGLSFAGIPQLSGIKDYTTGKWSSVVKAVPASQTSVVTTNDSSPQNTTAHGIWPQGTYTATEVIWGDVVKATATFSGNASLKLYDPVDGETLYSCYWVADYTGAIHTVRLTNVATGQISVESLIYNPSAGTVVLDGPVAEATYFK
jgi:hypothetical protein